MEVAEVTGVRLRLVHAATVEAASFYQRVGFEPSSIGDLMLLLKDIRRLER